ncbi:MAG: transcriptional regulator [Thaumarchaeota archaeon]|nr:MAG: transcriptional regulator [Nitrososphaerota archaeon]
MSTIKPFFRQQYRSSLGIAGEVLKACMERGIEGMPISHISMKTKVSYDKAVESCRKLIDAGLIELTRGKRKYFKITEKGIGFFWEFQKFQDFVKEVKIRY